MTVSVLNTESYHYVVETRTMRKLLRGRQKNAAAAVACLVVMPVLWVLFNSEDVTQEDVLENRMTELRDRIEHAEYMSREREGDAQVLHSQLDVLIQAQLQATASNDVTEAYEEEEESSSHSTGVMLSKETKQLLANLTIGSSDIQPPGIYHYLPHILGKPQALTPGIKVSQGRMGVSMVFGVPTIKRPHESYLLQTLMSLVESLSQKERKECLIVVFVAEPDDMVYVKKVADEITKQMRWAVSTGLVEIISGPPEFYPDMSNLKESFGDNKERVQWRTKQNLDYSFLMMYAKSRGTYYIQLEDDVVTKPGYLSTIKNFVLHQPTKDWILLEFSTLGFIGKLFKTSDLPTIVEFFLMFYKDKPIDWLLHSYLSVKVCSPERDNRHCDRSIAEVRRRFKPSLFQHVGTHSSLKGKVQKLKDKDFGRGGIQRANLNPIADVSTSLKVYQHYTLDRAYIGDAFFWGLIPSSNDVFVFKFLPPVVLEKYYIQSGNSEHPGDKLVNTTVEILPAISDTDNAGQADRSRYPMTEDGYYIIGQFDQSGIAQGIPSPALTPVDTLRLRVLTQLESWVIINEIAFKGETIR